MENWRRSKANNVISPWSARSGTYIYNNQIKISGRKRGARRTIIIMLERASWIVWTWRNPELRERLQISPEWPKLGTHHDNRAHKAKTLHEWAFPAFVRGLNFFNLPPTARMMPELERKSSPTLSPLTSPRDHHDRLWYRGHSRIYCMNSRWFWNFSVWKESS